ncbi:hypothetical protein B0O99DRAFT_351036 [Bisporella sp. PMI_857]|nr:hypothetical protein B0O99DRAFT_351036 [Bisporella sp. PMI_857]
MIRSGVCGMRGGRRSGRVVQRQAVNLHTQFCHPYSPHRKHLPTVSFSFSIDLASSYVFLSFIHIHTFYYLTYTMTTLADNLSACSFSTFHSNSIAIPVEISTQIIKYVVNDAQLSPLGGGITVRRAHHPIASVSSTLRSIFLNHPFPNSTEGSATQPTSLRIGETLAFSDLRTLAAFFQHKLGQHAATLQKVRFLSISYRDDDSVSGWWRQHNTTYAYEAFENLYNNWHHMQICWLELHLHSYRAISSINDPGVWSLLKVRSLAHLSVLGPHGCIAPEVRKCLKARTHRKKLFPWRPLGTEKPGPRDWINLVKHRGKEQWQGQYEWLDTRYKYLHDRETVTARHIKQRSVYHKRRRRWPMLSKRRRKGNSDYLLHQR